MGCGMAIVVDNYQVMNGDHSCLWIQCAYVIIIVAIQCRHLQYIRHLEVRLVKLLFYFCC